MRNIALKLMYNGTAYHGWQVQKNAVTVCETLQKALEKITGAPVIFSNAFCSVSQTVTAFFCTCQPW